jgi:glucose/arabinose dehydrogenase
MDKIAADANGYYAGGAISFGPDKKLYVTVGIGDRPEDAQNKSSLLGKLLCVNRDGSIPPDNPFPNSPIFALDLRNAFGIAFDKSGHGIIPDNGDTLILTK